VEQKKPSNRFYEEEDADFDNVKKGGRILYLAIVGVICAATMIIGLLAALNRDSGESKTVTPNASESASESVSESVSQSEKESSTEVVQNPDRIPEMAVPVSGSLSKVHDVTTPVYSVTMCDYRTHSGIDIAATVGATVTAVADGDVKNIWEDPLMGTCISLSIGGNAVAIYKNLGTVTESLREGTAVKAGDGIGTVGESALIEIAEEPHLHFELTVDGKAADPMSYFSAASVSANLHTDIYED